MNFLIEKMGAQNNPTYPYLPEGRTLLFVPLSNTWIQAAKEVADTETGCSWWPTGAVIVRDGTIVGKSANKGTFTFPCPRVENNSKSGEDYHFCKEVCEIEEYSHAEYGAVLDAKRKGNQTSGSDIYLFGHWWCCEPCWNKMIEAGIKNVYLVENAHEIFTPRNRKLLMKKLSTRGITDKLTSSDIRWEI